MRVVVIILLVMFLLAASGLLAAAVVCTLATQHESTAAVQAAPARERIVRTLWVFGSDNCQPCKRMEPIVDRIERSGTLVNRINVSRNNSFAEAYGVGRTPTFLLMESIGGAPGHELGRIEHECSESDLWRLVETGAGEPTQVLDDPQPEQPQNLMAARGEARASEPDQPVVGPQGWRLRLFYPPGDKRGDELKSIFEHRLTAIAAKYGFEAMVTNDRRFDPWHHAGFPSNKLSLVLVKADNVTPVYYDHNPPLDVAKLREALRTAAMKSWEAAK